MAKTKKKDRYIKKSYESTGISSDVSSNIYQSMVTSLAWKQLSSRQKVLYMYCKLQHYAQKNKPDPDDRTKFFLNQHKWLKEYELYPSSNLGAFYRDMEKLIEFGFIRCVHAGSSSRTKNVYQFSDKWRLYGTDLFEIIPTEMTGRMLRKRMEKP